MKTRKRLSTFQQLQKRLEKDLAIKAAEFKRTEAGRYQKKTGAWVWVATRLIDEKLSAEDIGSCYTATELIRSKGKLEIGGGGEIYPDQSHQNIAP